MTSPRKTFDLIPQHRKRAFLRKCFYRIDQVVSDPTATCKQILDALKALDLVMGLATPHNPTDKLAAALLEPDQLPDGEFWKSFNEIMELRKKEVEKISN